MIKTILTTKTKPCLKWDVNTNKRSTHEQKDKLQNEWTFIWFIYFKMSQKHPYKRCIDNYYQRIDIKCTISPVKRGHSIVNHQGHLPQLQQQMQINIAVLLCILTSWFITKCSKKARQKEKYAFCSLNCSKKGTYISPRKSAYFNLWWCCSWLFLYCASDPQVHNPPGHKKRRKK